MDSSNTEGQRVKVEEDVVMGGLDDVSSHASAISDDNGQEEFQKMMDDTSMAVDTPRNRTPGVKPGTVGKPRKDPALLSKNKHTTRARNRIDKLSGNERQIYLAKNRDASAVSASKSKLKNSPAYQAASEAQKRKMEDDDKKLVIYRRLMNGQHANNTALSLSLINDGTDILELGADHELSDTQAGWIDLTEEELENDPHYQAYLAYLDEEDYQFVGSNPLPTEDHAMGVFQQQGKDLLMIAFLKTRAYWQKAIVSLLRKMRHFGRERHQGVPWCDIDTCQHREFSMLWMVPSINNTAGRLRSDIILDETTNSYRAKRLLPHEYFTMKERAVWRNLASWKLVSESGWVEAPGPADWWPAGYDLRKHGWVPDEDSKKAELAYTLMTAEYGDQIPTEFEDFALTSTKLGMQ